MTLDNNFFEDILDKVPAEIMVADAEYRFLYANPVAVPDMHIREWMIGKTNEEFCQYSGRPTAMARARRMVFEKARRTRKAVEWSESLQDNEGVVQHFLHRIYPVFDAQDKFQQVIIYVVRITETKEFEEKVKLHEKRYRDLFNYSQALICTHDLNGNFLAVNPSICRALNYTEEEMLGRSIRDMIPDKHRPRFDEEYLAAVRNNNNTVVSGEFCVLSKEGQEIYLLYKNYRVEEPDLDPYVIGFAQDITDRIKMEKELRLTKQLTEEVARAKESFLAHMSHEIRTPMNGILGIASLLKKTQLDSQQRDYLQLIQESANNLVVIVNDILDLEKIVAGKLQLEVIPFKIVDKIATAIQSFVYRAEEKELGLIYQNFIPAALVVKGDPYRLSQVLNNILSNALKFTESGHITISSGINEESEDEVVVEITVSDTGIGIEKDRLRTVFEPFVQADATISRKYGGTGLGLAICKNMIEMQSGDLTVQSELGKGSAFTIRIPYYLSIEAMQENETGQEIDYKSLGHRKVLIAEDVELNQYLARHILESWDFEVVIANNGREAVEALAAASFDCVLMDVQMPEMDGMEATHHIRSMPDPVKAQIPIIALTANALKGDSEKYLEAGMTDYLAKPFDEERLFRVISRNLTPVAAPVSTAAPSTAAPSTAASSTAAPSTAAPSTGPVSPANSAASPTTGAAPVSASVTARIDIPLINTTTMSNGTRLYDLTMVQSVSGGDEGFIKKMVALFIETVPQNVQDLKKALQEENWEQVGKTAHKLKSTIDSMGIKTIRQEIRAVEANAKALESLQTIPSLVTTIDMVITECIGQLQSEILN